MLTEEDKKVWDDFCANMNKYVPSIRFVPLRRRTYLLDLHGMTLDDAYKSTLDFVEKSKYAGMKYITVVTGMSGNIKKEFPYWLSHNQHITKVELTNGGGAYKLYLKK